jgi:hypothetical protein
LLERAAHAECVRPQPFHLTRTENPGLAVTPWSVTRCRVSGREESVTP